MTARLSLITALVGAALVFAVPAWADPWGADQRAEPVHVSPDLADRAVAAQQDRLATMLDAREKSLSRIRGAATIVTFEPVRDDWFRRDPSTFLTADATSSSDRPVEWGQIGVGFGAGALLALGLFLAMRVRPFRQPAH